MDKYNLRSSKHLWAVFLTAGLFVPGLVQGATEQALSEIISMPAQKTITGKVIDETGETIIGANVVVKGTTNGAVTDMDGQFHLAVNDYPVTLTVSYIGYETQTVKVSSSKSIVITMQSDNQVMDEVIVTGYGTFKKSAYAGSASAVKADKIKDIPAYLSRVCYREMRLVFNSALHLVNREHLHPLTFVVWDRSMPVTLRCM